MNRCRRRGATIAILGGLTAVLAAAPTSTASADDVRPSDAWMWPVEGPILRGFDVTSSPYGRGHRGLDLAAPRGTVLVAPADGVVASVGRVGGNRYLTLEVGDALITLSFVGAVDVRVGDRVARGVPVATTGDGHPTNPFPHVHVSVRIDDVYVDPFPHFVPIDVSPFIRLVPLA